MKTRLSPIILIGLLKVVLGDWAVAAPAPLASQPKEIASFQAHPYIVKDLAFSPDGKLLVSCGGEGRIKLWEVDGWKNLADVRSHPSDGLGVLGTVSRVAFGPTGKIIASWGDDHKVRLWDVPSGRRVETLGEGRPEGLPLVLTDGHPLVFSPDGKTLICGLRFIDVKTHTSQRIVDRLKGIQVKAAAFDPRGKILLATASGWPEPPCIWIWDTKAGKVFATCKGQTTHGGCLAFSRDGKMIASATFDHGVRIWDVATGKNKISMDCPGRHCALVFSSNGSILAVGYKHQEEDGKTDARPERGSVRLYETSTGRILVALEGKPGPIAPLAFSPDGRLLASGSFNGIITVWSLPRRYSDEKETEKTQDK